MNTFANIDQNKLATAKQVYGVACHFANIHAASPSERYGLTKVFNAILNKFYGDQDAHMTHGEVTDFREHQVVPSHFLELVRKPKPKAVKKVAVIKEVKPKATATATAAKKPTPVVNSVAKKMDARITALETKVSDVDNKLDAILAILSK